MRRLASLCLFLCICLALCACSKKAKSVPQSGISISSVKTAIQKEKDNFDDYKFTSTITEDGYSFMASSASTSSYYIEVQGIADSDGNVTMIKIICKDLDTSAFSSASYLYGYLKPSSEQIQDMTIAEMKERLHTNAAVSVVTHILDMLDVLDEPITTDSMLNMFCMLYAGGSSVRNGWHMTGSLSRSAGTATFTATYTG